MERRMQVRVDSSAFLSNGRFRTYNSKMSHVRLGFKFRLLWLLYTQTQNLLHRLIFTTMLVTNKNNLYVYSLLGAHNIIENNQKNTSPIRIYPYTQCTLYFIIAVHSVHIYKLICYSLLLYEGLIAACTLTRNWWEINRSVDLDPSKHAVIGTIFPQNNESNLRRVWTRNVYL